MQCQNCKFSSPASEEDAGTMMLDCECDKFLQEYGIEKDDLFPGCVHVENDEGWAFTVSPEFGCVHFIQR